MKNSSSSIIELALQVKKKENIFLENNYANALAEIAKNDTLQCLPTTNAAGTPELSQ